MVNGYLLMGLRMNQMVLSMHLSEVMSFLAGNVKLLRLDEGNMGLHHNCYLNRKVIKEMEMLTNLYGMNFFHMYDIDYMKKILDEAFLMMIVMVF